MFYSASFTESRETRFGRFDRAIARLLVAAILWMTPLPSFAGDEFQDANNTSYDTSVVSLDNSLAGETTFTIDTTRTIIDWQDFQQPGNNTLDFHFVAPIGDSTVLNRVVGSTRPSNIFGTILSNGNVIVANRFGVFVREGAVVDVGSFVAVGANISRQDFQGGRSMVLPLTGSIFNGGLIRAEGNISLLGRSVVNDGTIHSENGYVFAAAGQHLTVHDWDALTTDFLAPKKLFGLLSGGEIENNGSITARDAALFAGRIQNMGDIEVRDGTLLMVAADAVWVTEFDNPVLIKIPSYDPTAHATADSSDSDVQYAIENHGRLDAGLGHVRLAASDALGFAIRQGTGAVESAAIIVASEVTIEGGETGRVHLSGEIDADGASDVDGGGAGGEINITGEMIVLEDADIHASGSTGGGTIHVGGEQEGRGDLQRARLVVVDAESEIRADAIDRGDGGTVIVFAEDFTSVNGEISARGGAEGGDGGFVETSGLARFSITRTPDVTAPAGRGGDWLIDPFNITIDNTPIGADTNLNNAILAILDPTFDSAGFDGILRTVSSTDMDMNGDLANLVSADLIANALAAGTSVTLSTQAFGVDNRGSEAGNINIFSDIVVLDGTRETIEGTSATLRLLAAGDINVESDILAYMIGEDPMNFALTIELRANDLGQIESDQDFDASELEGDLSINGDLRTGGGAVVLTGSSVTLSAGQSIVTEGGIVDIRSGTIDPFGNSVFVTRQSSDPMLDAMTTPDPTLDILGDIDTSNGSETGGSVSMVASSINVRTSQSGTDPEQIISGQLNLSGMITSGGGVVSLSGGVPGATASSNFAGNVDVDGNIDSGGGAVAIFSNHIDPNGETGTVDVTFLKDPMELGGIVEGGFIDIDANITTAGGTLTVGSERTRSIAMDGIFNTTQMPDPTENGLVQIVARDLSGVSTVDGEFGFGEITIGGTMAAPTATTISSSSIVIEARDVTFSDGAGLNAVTLTASGSSTATLPEISTQLDELTIAPESGAVTITGDRQLTFNQNTAITAESIQIVAAARPTNLNIAGPNGDERVNSETRLTFNGMAGAVPTTGVRLSADSIAISVGDGTTSSSDGFAQDLGSSAAPTDFGLQRLTRAIYDGLQLRNTGGGERPDEVQIRQDGDLTILAVAPTNPGELDLVGAFGGALIGSDGMQITLEASDGRLTIEDAVGLNNNAGVTPGSDAGKSFVVLNGGLYLPPTGMTPTFLDDSVLFRDGVTNLGDDGTTAFDVGSLKISSAGSFTIRQQILDGIDVSDPMDRLEELTFEAGRSTGATDPNGRGTLTVDGGLAIESGDRLALLAGGSGFGDLVFAGGGTMLAADDLELRAGGAADSQNTDTATRSRITGLQSNVAIRDARFATIGIGAVFGDAASTATSFAYQQDAAIDGQMDLPDLADFGLTASGFRAAGDIEYSVRSDYSNIDLDDELVGTNEGDRFQNANLSLIGVDSSSTPAIDVSSEFNFVGKRVELGAIGDFTFTQSLASAFNRSGTDAEEEITLRAGVGGVGNLDFNRGTASSVIVKAPRINLVAGAGREVDDQGVLTGESEIDTRNAEFDLAAPMGSVKTFTFSTTSFLTLADLPETSQFVGNILPNILALRTDVGLLDLRDFDATSLPLDLVDDPGDTADDRARLILEAEDLRLSQTDGDNLDLTSIANLKLRLRTNFLSLTAANSDIDLAFDAEVMIGPQAGDDPVPADDLPRPDSYFDDESLLIEAFDRNGSEVTVANLSSLSETSEGSDEFYLPDARGPTAITITQDAAITPANLFHRDAVAGGFTRSFDDDADGNAVATIYSLTSVVNAATVDPENVNGSTLVISGTALDPFMSGVNFGSPGTAGDFFFESVFATSESSINIQSGTELTATNTLSLAASQLLLDVDNPGEDFGGITFETGSGTTTVAANRVVLTAGPSFKLDLPDGDGDGEPDPIDDDDLPGIDFRGLARIDRIGNLEDSEVVIRQSASLDSTMVAEDDYLTPLLSGMSSGMFETLTLSLVQGDLTIDQLDNIASIAESFVAQTIDLENKIVVDLMALETPFAAFAGAVEFQSNDILFKTTDADTSINLDSNNLTLVSTDLSIGFTPADELGRLRDDPDVDNRPIVRIHQVADFTSTELPQPSQYEVINILGNRNVRTDLSGLDIELKLNDASGTLTLDDDIRARVTTANLILDSVNDIDIMLTGPTPGFDFDDPAFENVVYGDLQLTSLDFTADGTINVGPFMSGDDLADLTIETSGDQRFNGTITLENTLSTRGRDIRFTDDIGIPAMSTATAGLLVASSGKIHFEGDIGTASDALDRLIVTFDSGSDSETPRVEFGTRSDPDMDGIFTPDPSDQSITVDNDIAFVAYDFADEDRTVAIDAAIGSATTLADLATSLAAEGIGRPQAAAFATIGKADGTLTVTSQNGNFVMGSGEKLSVGGVVTIDVDDGVAILGDVSALGLTVVAGEIGLIRRAAGVVFDRSGETQQDGGPSISANSIDFRGVTPSLIGSGRSYSFGLPDPFDAPNIPAGIGGFPLFEIKPDGGLFVENDFLFISTSGDLTSEIPLLRPTGASRSDLSGAFGPEVEPVPQQDLPELVEPRDADRLMELAVDAQDTPNEVLLARLEGVAIIDDLGRTWDDETATVTTARINARDAEAAIVLYERLFGRDGQRAAQIRSVLQDALDRYLENSRARRVVGFELRRFVKNRPSTLLKAYNTLDLLDTLFQYHRRLGLSPGEYRRIQENWLRQIQPDGITLDELSETIHPSRYVRGSDILDIFGR